MLSKKYFLNIIFALFLNVAVCSVVSSQQAIIGVSPVEVYLSGKPGSTSSQQIIVSNRGDGAFLFDCTFEDYWFNGSERKSAPLGTYKERQAGPWLQCNPNRILIPAKRKQRVDILAAIPKGSEGDSFAVYYAQMLPPQELKNTGNQSLQMAGRIGARVVVTTLGTQKPDASVSGAVVTQEKRFQVFKASLHNKGNVHLMGEGTLILTDENGKQFSKSQLTLDFTFPGMTQKIHSTLVEKIPSGKYQAILTIVPSQKSGSSLVQEFPVQVQ